ncbi:MAG: hypothetical protein ACRBHB_15650 [Arenicella sp.]
MKNILLMLFVCVVTNNAYALSTKNLPEISRLDSLLNAPDQKEVDKRVKKQGGVIRSGLAASDKHRGTTAAEIAGLLSNGSADAQKQFEDAFEQERQMIEKFLEQNNFAINDMGVAYAFSFISLWELAHDHILPVEAELAAGKYMVHMFEEVKTEYALISDEEKDKAYDWFMATPIAFVGLYKSFKEEGAEQNAVDISKKSAQLFQEVFKFPHTYFTFSDKGEFGVNTDALLDDARAKDTAKSSKKSDW